MSVLVLVFCLQSTPASCTEERSMEGLSLQVCLIHGQQYALEWLAEHPKWRLSRWRCEQNVPLQRPA
jgi:hypothetical protein